MTAPLAHSPPHMASTIALRCDDAPVRTAVRAWLDGTEISPPDPLAVHVRLVGRLGPQEDRRTPFRQPTVIIRSGSPDQPTRLDWRTAPATAELGIHPEASVFLTPEAVARLDECLSTFFTPVLILLLRRARWHHIHAATVMDPSGRGWLLAGDSHAGKSTTTALLGANGWRVGADDSAFLFAHDGRVLARAPRSLIALRPGGRALLAQAVGRDLDHIDPHPFSPSDLGTSWTPQIAPQIALFLASGGTRTSGTPLSAPAALAQLVRASAWVMLEHEFAQQHLDLLTDLARQVRAYRVVLGPDLSADPSLILDLVQ